MYTVAIVTSSDKGSKGEREDKSGAVIREIVEKSGFQVKRYVILPDEKELLKEEFIYLADELGVNLVLSTGGTGFSPRDITPEATRMFSLNITKRAMLSRAASGIRKKTLIVNLPGSPKACKEALDFVLEDIKHGIDILNETAKECARK